MQKWNVLYTIFAVIGGALILLDLMNIITLTSNANLFLGGVILLLGSILQLKKEKRNDNEEEKEHIEEKIKERDQYFENEYNAEKNE